MGDDIDIIFYDTSTFKLYDSTISKWEDVDGKQFGSISAKPSIYLKLYLAYSFNTGVVNFDFQTTLKNDNANPEIFLSELIRKMNKREEKWILILDNAQEHHKEEICELFNFDNLFGKILYIPSGSSPLNLVEYVFCLLKKNQRSKRIKSLKPLK